MLKICHCLHDVCFSSLLDVYKDTFQRFISPESKFSAEQEFYFYLKDCFFVDSAAFYSVWEAQGRYAAALRIEPYRDGFLICGLETMPCERRQGYAARLLIAVLAYLKGIDNPIVYSHISKTNQPSLATHLKCGFHILLDYAVYSDGSVLHNHYTMVNSN